MTEDKKQIRNIRIGVFVCFVFKSILLFQISDDNIGALISKENAAQVKTNLKQVYNDIATNLTAAQQKVTKRKLSKGEDD